MLALLLAAGVASAGGKKEGSAVKIGVIGVHSGDLSGYGIPTIRAAELIAKAVNAGGGILGRPLELLIADDECEPEIAVDAAAGIIAENVVAVVGHICSGATLAALPLYLDANIPCISPLATDPQLTVSGEYPNFFRTVVTDHQQAKVIVDFSLNRLNLTRIAVLHDDSDYGRSLAEFVERFLNDDGRAEVVLSQGMAQGDEDYAAAVDRIDAAGAEAVIFGGYHPEASGLVTRMRKNGMDTIFLSDDGVKEDIFIEAAGEFAEGAYVTALRNTTSNPLAVEAVEEYRKEYGEDPGAFFLNAYAAVQAVLNALRKAGSTDYQAVTRALRSEWVETCLGNISFDAKGDIEGIGFSLYQVQDGQYVEIESGD